MAIHINKVENNTRIRFPRIRLTGVIVDPVDGTYDLSSVVDYNPSGDIKTIADNSSVVNIRTAQITQNGTTFTRRDEIIFRESVNLSFTYDSQYTNNPYPTGTTYSFVGEKTQPLSSFNLDQEIYYTLNGKDPKRSKKYLYTGGDIRIRRNTTGSDKTKLKVRAYALGLISPVVIVEFRILKSNPLRV